MSPRRRKAKAKAAALREVDELGNRARNERQKAVLLREVASVRCGEVSAAIESGKQIVERSKKLCERASNPHPSHRKKA